MVPVTNNRIKSEMVQFLSSMESQFFLTLGPESSIRNQETCEKTIKTFFHRLSLATYKTGRHKEKSVEHRTILESLTKYGNECGLHSHSLVRVDQGFEQRVLDQCKRIARGVGITNIDIRPVHDKASASGYMLKHYNEETCLLF